MEEEGEGEEGEEELTVQRGEKMYKIGYGVKPFAKELKNQEDVIQILLMLEEGLNLRIQKLQPERTCMVPNRGVPCGKKFYPERQNQRYCSPWCQNRASTQASRAS